MNVRVVGGPPSAVTGDQGDVLEIETPGAVADDVQYTPTGSETGRVVLNEDGIDGYQALGTDTLIEIFATLPPLGLPTGWSSAAHLLSPGGIEQLIYEGESSNDNLRVDAGSRFVHTPGAAVDAGRMDILTGGVTQLGINYQNLGAGGHDHRQRHGH